MIELNEPDNGERFSREQTKMLMMFLLGMTPIPEPLARGMIAKVFEVYDAPESPLHCMIQQFADKVH